MTTARVNINIGDNSKKVQPLYWINPNNFIYSELNAPQHMKMPKVVLPDADKDGVTDQFDMEPNTPAGAPVDFMVYLRIQMVMEFLITEIRNC